MRRMIKVSKSIICPKCEYIINVNTWGIPKNNQLEVDWGALKRARKKLEKEIGFGIKPKK